LSQPSVAAGLIPPSALAGYRNDFVFLRISRYVPLRWEAVRDAMPALFDLLEPEAEPAVRAVLGHWLFGYIHPYMCAVAIMRGGACGIDIDAVGLFETHPA